MEMMEGKKSVSYWYKAGRWQHFIGLYKDGTLVKGFLDSVEVDPIVLWIMDEPTPQASLTIWNGFLTSPQIIEVNAKTDMMTLPFSNLLTHWYKL